MPYYRKFRGAISMSRGRGFMRGSLSSSRGSWSGGRGSSSWSSRGSWHHSPRGGFPPRGGHSGHSSSGGGGGSSSSSHRMDSFSSSFDSRSKYASSSSKRYSSSSKSHDDPRKSYKGESSYSGRESSHRSPERKRPRNEAPSSRHDSSYGGYGSSRYESSYTDRRSFSSDRHPTPFSRRDEFRRPSGPPRGGYRGRISSRGSRGMKLREHLPPRRRLNESSYAVRKRILSTRSIDHARRLKISKLRSAIAARKKDSGSKSEDEKRDDKKDDHREESKKVDDDKKDDDDDDDEDEDNTRIERGTPPKPDKDEDTGDGSKKSEKEDKCEKADKTDESSTKRKAFIKLNCPHCGIKAVTFRKYDLHLQSRTHMMAMRKVALKQKSILAQMRLAQRSAQNELEKSSEDLTPRTNFCPLCKLNYKQRKAVHQGSEAHKNMKKFLMPYCKVCSITFKSPMTYESHCCSIEHLKRKQRLENGEHSDEFDDNLDNFTTIDSVGDGDATDDEDSKDIKEPVSVGIEQIRKVEAYYCDLCKLYVGRSNDESITSVLTKHCKQRTHMQRYIRYKEDKDIEKRAEKLQRKETAEKEDKKQRLERDNCDEDGDIKSVKHEDKDDENQGKNLEDEEARDDKLWADVDKDLDDLLAKESGNKSSDEDEDVNGERYDRFKYSEKNGDEKKENQIDGNTDDIKINNTTEDN